MKGDCSQLWSLWGVEQYRWLLLQPLPLQLPSNDDLEKEDQKKRGLGEITSALVCLRS